VVADASKRVFYNDITRDAFIETNCDTCYFPARAMHRIDPSKPDCPHLERAAENKLPKEWSRRRNAVMGETYRCSDRLVQPPVNRRNYQDLSKMLEGNTFAGSNPTFDSQRLKWHTNVVWHHRLLDLAAYSAGVLRLPPNHLQGLEWVCKELGVENTEPHSALGDARATAECFRKLMEMAK
jgi:hypothetical protein